MMITSVNATPHLAVVASATAPRRAGTAAAASAQPSVAVSSLPASPPAEVLAEMRVAASAYDRLAADGRTLRFDTHSETGRVTAAITDADGNVTSTLSLRDVLAVAAGASLS